MKGIRTFKFLHPLVNQCLGRAQHIHLILYSPRFLYLPRCHLTISGIAYHTKRACDNCDRPIEVRMIISENDGCWDVGIHTLMGTNTAPTPIQDGSWEDDFSSFIGGILVSSQE